jgi:hypothetical protein
LTERKPVSHRLRYAGEMTALAYLKLLRLGLYSLVVVVFPLLCFIGLFCLGALIATILERAGNSSSGLTAFIIVGFPAYAFLFFVIYSLPYVRPGVCHLLAQIKNGPAA